MIKKIEIKPLSINEAWQGKRFKTKKYTKYEKDLLFILPKTYKLPPPPYEIYLEWGFSNKASDWDNPIKPLQDVLQKKYKNFNDKDVYFATVKKVIVGRGKEYIKFELKTYAE